jgi:cytochrome c553
VIDLIRFFNHLAGMKIIFSCAIALSLVLFVSTGCKYDVDEELNPMDTSSLCDTTSMNYQKISAVFLQGTCTTCHSGANADAGLDLSTYAGVSAYLGSSSSTLIDRITVGTTGDIMPPVGNKLDSCNVSKISAWINAGFPE